MSEKQTKMLKTAVFMAMMTLLAKVCGLVRETLVANTFAGGIERDAFYTATTLPTTLFDVIIGGVISASFIPTFNDILQKKGKDEAYGFANKFIGGVLFITAIIVCVGMMFSGGLVSLIAAGYDADKHALSVLLTRIMFPMLFFTALAFSFVGILQSFGEFNIPSIISLVSNLVVIAYFPLLCDRFGVVGLAVTMLIAWSLQVLIQVPTLKRLQFRFRPRISFDADIRSTVALALPMLVCTWMQPLCSLVSSRLASGTEAAVSSLQYSYRLYLVAVGVFSFVVTNLVFPKMSSMNSSNDKDEANGLVVSSAKAVVLVILPLSICFISIARQIIFVLNLNSASDAVVSMEAGFLAAYSVGMLGFALNEVFSKAFFARHNSVTPMINSIISMAVTIAFFLVYHFGGAKNLITLAFATALGATVNAILNYVCLSKEGKIFTRGDWVMLLKTLLCGAAMAGAIFGAKRTFSGLFPETVVGNLIFGGVIALLGIIIYFVLCYVLKIDEIRAIVKGGKSK